MDLRQLRYFLGALKAGSLTKAAEALHVAQPALGTQIRNLEAELGVELLVRHSRGIEPTEAGAVLARHAETLLRDCERIRQDVSDIGGVPRGLLTVGMTETVMHVAAARLLDACASAHPAIRLRFSEGMSERLSEWMVDGRLDIALTYNPPVDSGLVCEALASEVLYFAMPMDVILPDATTIAFREVLRFGLILTSHGSLFRTRLEEAAQAIGMAPRVVCEADSPAMIKQLVRSGFGCSVVPYGGILPEVGDGHLRALPIVDPELHRTLYVVYSKKRFGTKAQEVVLDEIRALVGDMVTGGVVGWEPLAEPARPSRPDESPRPGAFRAVNQNVSMGH